MKDQLLHRSLSPITNVALKGGCKLTNILDTRVHRKEYFLFLFLFLYFYFIKIVFENMVEIIFF
jgi:hypothetical protein